MRASLCVLIAVVLLAGRPAAGASYAVEISGVEDKQLAELIDAVSLLKARVDRPPHSDGGLRRRIAEDRALISEALRSEGYYQSSYTAKVDRSVEPPTVRVEVAPGPRFHIGKFEPRLVSGSPKLLSDEELKKLPAKGQPARAPEIVAAETRLLASLAENGHPFAKVTERKIVVDHATETVDVSVAIEPGSRAIFGETDLEGLDSVKAGYVQRQIKWQQGEAYDQRKVDDTRRTLVRTGLFDSVRIGQPVAENAADDQPIPMEIDLHEALQRSFGGSVEYATDTGLGGTLFWEHRNVFGGAERLNLTAEVSEVRRALRAKFGKPNFPTPPDTFNITTEAKDEQLDAYDSHGASTTVGVTRDFGGGLSGTFGVGGEVTRITDNADTETFYLLSLPTQLTYDRSDAPLDPSRGWRLTFGYTPFYDFGGQAGLFNRVQGSIAGYYPVIEEQKRLVLAARLSVGTLFGAAVTDIPAPYRFYAGGGALRGYAYQLAGPIDADKDPVGGKSAIESSIEARFRVTENFGVVPFIDAGKAYRNSVPEPGSDILFAAGIGIRYFTSFAPLRADIAFPLNGRKGVDDAFQFYVGIGQAF